jgi:hypothetical protein
MHPAHLRAGAGLLEEVAHIKANSTALNDQKEPQQSVMRSFEPASVEATNEAGLESVNLLYQPL